MSSSGGLWRWAWRELRSSRGRHATKISLVVFVLVIGFIGPFLSAAIRSSVGDYLERSSRRILSADLVVSSMRSFEPRELEWLKQAFARSRRAGETEFVTMARGAGVAALVEVKGVDAEFPIHGEFRFENPEGRARSAAALNGDERLAWAMPEILAQLALKPGDEIAVGKSRFRVAAVLKDAPGAGRTAGLAPRLYVGRKFIAETGLTQYGAQVFHRVYLDLPEGESVEIAAAKIKSAFPSGEILVRTPDDAIQGFERFFRFFNLYLVTVSMVVFVLSWAGAAYILQIYLQERLPNAAVFMIYGASRARAAALYLLQLLMMTAAAFAAAALVGSLAIRTLARVLAEHLPEDFHLRLAARDLAVLAGVAGLSALALALPFFQRLYSAPLNSLLTESSMGVKSTPRSLRAIAYLAPVAIFVGVAVWLMESWLEAFRLVGGMLAVAALGLVIGRAAFRGFFELVRRRSGLARLVAMQLARSRFGVNLCFLALMLVALAANLVPHLLSSVVGAVMPLEGRELPQLFLFNIPESALAGLRSYADTNQVELRYLSPMILGRLLKVNGVDTDNDQFQRFPVRLSYREGPIASEQIIAGRAFSGRYDESREPVAEISVENKFAERNRLRLGDAIEFEVQSVPIKARVVSLRRVQWTSFNPNFFIMFQPGVLDDAPKTWIANVNFAQSGDAEKVRIQYELNRDFPDLTVLDIGRTIERVLEVARSVIAPVTAAAWSAVAMSFMILFGVVAHNLRLRERELDLEKLLGADRSLIRRLLVFEYAAIAFFAWLIGTISAFGLAVSVARQVLDVPFQASGGAVVVSFAATLALTVGISYFLASRTLGRGGVASRL